MLDLMTLLSYLLCGFKLIAIHALANTVTHHSGSCKLDSSSTATSVHVSRNERQSLTNLRSMLELEQSPAY